MRNKDDVLKIIGKQLHIKKGDGESEFSYRFRIIYSAVSIMTFASLWDVAEQDEEISITYFKRKAEELFNSYYVMFLSDKKTSLEKKTIESFTTYLYESYKRTGFIYHKPNRICPARPSKAVSEDVCFMRAPNLNENFFMSGFGTYKNSFENTESELSDIYLFSSKRVELYWKDIMAKQEWRLAEDLSLEYLNTKFKDEKTYWISKPDKGYISLARTPNYSQRDYFIYKMEEELVYVSSVKNEYMINGNYRMFAWKILKNQEPSKLKVKYRNRGSITYVKTGYIFPTNEHNFFQLYSWPVVNSIEDLMDMDFTGGNIFERVMNTEVFCGMKIALEKEGVEFQEVD